MNSLKSTFKVALFTILISTIFHSCEKDLTLNKSTNYSKIGVSESTILVAKLVNGKLNNLEFRSFLYDQIGNKFDGDYNVLFNDLLDQKSEFMKDFEKLEIEIDPLLQIAVPKHFSKLSIEHVPKVFIVPNLPEDEIFEIYELKGMKLFPYDVNVIPDEPVIVLNLNERVTYDPENNTYIVDESYQYYDRLMENDEEIRINTRGGLPSGPCNYGRDGDMYLVGLRSTNLAGIEPWISGKPELRLNIMASENEYLAQQGQGNNIMETFYKPKRGDIEPGWMYVNDYLFYWPESYPETIGFKWVEEDGGVFSQSTEKYNRKIWLEYLFGNMS